MIRYTCVILPILAVLAGCTPGRFDHLPQSMVELDSMFTRDFAAARARILESGVPLIIDLNQRVVVVRDGQQKSWPVLPDDYILLKTWAYAPMTLVTLLEPTVGQLLSSEQLEGIDEFRSVLQAAESSIGQVGFSPTQESRQRQIVRKCLSFSTQVLEQRRVHQHQLNRWARSMAPLFIRNVQEAAVAQLAALDVVIQRILAEFTPREQSSFLVVVAGVPQAREDNLAVQYYQSILGHSSTQERRIIYLEDTFSVAAGEVLAGDLQINVSVSNAFFDKPYRLERDILGDAAASWVDIHSPSMPPSSSTIKGP